jgi:hypothetical protein
LPLVSNWTAANSAFVGCNQPAWAPSNSGGNFLPALMNANSCTANVLGTDPINGLANVMPGDVVTHTVDGFNGTPANGVANFLFTLPTGNDGKYEIRGSVWDAGLFFGTTRPQDWKLLINGVQAASGFLSGSVSRSQAETFDVFANLAAGDTVDLQLFQDPNSAAGFFVGTNMSIFRPQSGASTVLFRNVSATVPQGSGATEGSSIGSYVANAFEFSPTTTGTFTNARMDLWTNAVDGNVTASFYSDAGGKPGTLLAQLGTTAVPFFSSFPFLSFGANNTSFTQTSGPAVTLAAGSNYWLVVAPGDATSFVLYAIGGATANVNQAQQLAPGGAWISAVPANVQFEIDGTP